MLKDLYKHIVNKAVCKWKEIGVQLLPPEQENEIQNIEAENLSGKVERFQRVLEKWLETDTNATWNKLIEALRCPSVSLIVLADQLEQKFNNCKYGINSVAIKWNEWQERRLK